MPRPLKGVIRMLFSGEIGVYRRSEDVVVSQKIDPVTLCVLIVSDSHVSMSVAQKGVATFTWEVNNPERADVIHGRTCSCTIIIPFSVPDKFVDVLIGMWRHYQKDEDSQ